MQLILSYKSIIVSMLVVSFISAQNVCAESERSARYRSLIDQATDGHYEILKNFEPELALTLWVMRLRRLRMSKKAQPLMARIVSAQAKTFGVFDLRVASSLKILGDLTFDYGALGQHHYAKSLIIYSRILPYNNPLTCLTLGDLAMRLAESPSLTNKSFLLFQLQGLMLRALFPGKGEATAAKECTAQAISLTSKVPMGHWIQNLDLTGENARTWETELIQSRSSNALNPLQDVFRAQLNQYSQLVARTLGDSDAAKPVFPVYIDASTGVFRSPKNVTEVPEILRGNFAPGTISCKCFYNSQRKIAGFACNVASEPSPAPLKSPAKTGLEVTMRDSDYDEFKTLRELSAEFNNLCFRNPLVRFPFALRIDAPLSVNKQCVEYFGDIRESVKRNWHPLGFSYLQPIKIGFDIDAGGNVLNRKVLASSGDTAYDQVAFDSFEKAYSPLPKEFGKSVHLTCSFGSLASSEWISSPAKPNLSPHVEQTERSELRKMADLQKQIVEIEYGKKE